MVVNVNSRRHKGRFYPIAFDVYRHMRDWQLWDILVWYVPNALPQPRGYSERLFDNKFEHLMVFLKGDPKLYTFHKPRVPQKYIVADPREHKKNASGRCIGNIVRIPAYRPPNVKSLGYHEAAFPEELVALMLESFTDEGDVVLDPFLGSGTTLQVARAMKRRGIGVEINRKYRALIERRIRTPWEVPDWKNVDVIHSTSPQPGTKEPRRLRSRR
jgi:DNA modification methylase